MPLSEIFKQFFKKFKSTLIILSFMDNFKTFINLKLKRFSTHTDSVIDKMTLHESVNLVNRVFEDYIKYSTQDINKFMNKRILEVGPGDNLSIALKFLAIGATKLVCIDKFKVMSNIEKRMKLYSAIRESLDEDSKLLFDKSIDLEDGIKINSKKLKYLFGIGIHEADDLLKQDSFDFIVSTAVLEHIYEIDSAFHVMDKILTSGGYMLHKIDFRDHGMFSKSGFHPLTFLNINDVIYRLMTKYSSKPNRRLIDYYEKKMIEFNYEYKFYINLVVGYNSEIIPHINRNDFNVNSYNSSLKLVNNYRQKLNSKYKQLSTEDLMISGIFLIAKKPKL